MWGGTHGVINTHVLLYSLYVAALLNLLVLPNVNLPRLYKGNYEVGWVHTKHPNLNLCSNLEGKVGTLHNCMAMERLPLETCDITRQGFVDSCSHRRRIRGHIHIVVIIESTSGENKGGSRSLSIGFKVSILERL